MAEATIPVDLFNPGQVFACHGLLTVADRLLGDAEAAFDWTTHGATRFVLRARGVENPVERALRFLASAEVVALAPHATTHEADWNKNSWGSIRVLADGAPYPFANPSSPATLAAELRSGNEVIVIDHWGDSTDRRDNVKFWAGSGGYPGAALARDALELVRSKCNTATSDPFAVAAPQSSSFSLDWRRNYIPIDAGFSVNNHADIKTVGYPLVELLAAIGLTDGRPARISWRDKLNYRFGVVGRPRAESTWYAPPLLRAALGGAALPFPSRRFHMSLGWPGKEGQARAITTVIEETTA